MEFNINNIKLSVKLELISLNIVKEFLASGSIGFKEFQNFIVFDLNFTYTIFKAKGKCDYNHVNITKISSLKHVDDSLKILKDILGKNINSYKIDNIIATSNWNKSLNILKLSQIKYDFPVKYNNQKFPGLFIKYKKGTALVFFSGKVVIVGCKNQTEINEIAFLLSEIFNML